VLTFLCTRCQSGGLSFGFSRCLDLNLFLRINCFADKSSLHRCLFLRTSTLGPLVRGASREVWPVRLRPVTEEINELEQ
jgi:hypothetical protein